jgi:hypothetical protein
MKRSLVFLATALLAWGARPVAAQTDDELRAEAADLTRRADALEARRGVLLHRDISNYLADVAPEAGAEGGGGLQGLTLNASLTGIVLATVGSSPSDTHSVHGDIELDFNLAVTENLDLFVDLVANSNSAAFPTQFGPIAGSAGATLSGLVDGIGVDGTVSTAPGDVAAYQWGATWTVFVGDHAVDIMGGQIDPREYYATNAFAADAHTQFLNNLFDDPPALDWPTSATGPAVYGLRAYTEFGPKRQYSFDAGWFNQPGRWFDKGLLLMEVAWKEKLKERDFHLRACVQINTASKHPAAAVCVSFDWYATEKIGVFARGTVKDNQPVSQNAPNQIESDWQVGGVFFGPIGQRPDDQLGVGFGMIKGPVDAIIPNAPKNHEFVLEVYYTLMLAGGKLQVSPEAQCVIYPGGDSFANGDNLYLLGIRIYVPF